MPPGDFFPGAPNYLSLSPTVLGATRQARQTIPRPTLPLPGTASAASDAEEPVAARRAATNGAAKLVPRTKV